MNITVRLGQPLIVSRVSADIMDYDVTCWGESANDAFDSGKPPTNIQRFRIFGVGSFRDLYVEMAFVHVAMIKLTTEKVYGENMLEKHIPQRAAYMPLIPSRVLVQVQQIEAERVPEMDIFLKLNVKYGG